MPLQNRVTPFGELLAISNRGTLTGNRGIIHEPDTRQLARRSWTTRAWIACTCDYKGRRREVWVGRKWTELFFLDEATALAAGHRPCFTCRRDEARAFQSAWGRASGMAAPRAPEMDRVLHEERLEGRAKRLHPLNRPLASLPDGAMAAEGAKAYLIRRGRPILWTPGGYVDEGPMDLEALALLTPPAICKVLENGYRAGIHPSANDLSGFESKDRDFTDASSC